MKQRFNLERMIQNGAAAWVTLLMVMGAIVASPASGEAQEPEWISFAEDIEGDGQYPGVVDGKEAFYYYDSERDLLWFKIDTYGGFNSSIFGLNLIMRIPGDNFVMGWWGTNSSFRLNRLVTFWVQGSPPNNYSGVIGISDAGGVQSMNYMRLASGNIGADVRENEKSYIVFFPRSDLISDELFDAGPVSIDVIAAVGTNQLWNDDIPNSGMGTISIEKAIDPPTIVIGDNVVEFGEVEPGQSDEKLLAVRNQGGSDLVISAVTIVAGADAAAFSVVDGASLVIAPGRRENITLRFAPAESRGYAAAIEIASNAPAPDNLITIDLQGVGSQIPLDPPEPELSLTVLDFKDVPVGKEGRMALDIGNTGEMPLEVQSISIVGSGSEAFTLNGGDSFSVEPDAMQSVEVVFLPPGDAVYEATLEIRSNAPAPNDILTLPIRGEGTMTTSYLREDLIAAGDLRLYPNPASETLVLRYSLLQAGMLQLSLTDARGRSVTIAAVQWHPAGEHTISIDLADFDLASGSYYLNLRWNNTPAASLAIQVQ